MDIRKRLGQNVRRLRVAKGLSQEAFAHEAGIHRTYVSDIERGARNPTILIIDLSKPFQKAVPSGRLFSPDQSAAHLLGVIDHLTPDQSGRCFAWDGAEINP